MFSEVPCGRIPSLSPDGPGPTASVLAGRHPAGPLALSADTALGTLDGAGGPTLGLPVECPGLLAESDLRPGWYVIGWLTEGQGDVVATWIGAEQGQARKGKADRDGAHDNPTAIPG